MARTESPTAALGHGRRERASGGRRRLVDGLIALLLLAGCSAESNPSTAPIVGSGEEAPQPIVETGGEAAQPVVEAASLPEWLPVSTDAAQPGPAPEGWPWVRVLANGDVVPSDCEVHRDAEPSPHARFEAWLDCVTSRGETEPSDSGMDDEGRVWSRGLVVYAHRDAPFARVSRVVGLGLGRPVRVRRFYLAARSASTDDVAFVDLTRPTDHAGRTRQELETMEVFWCPVSTWVQVLKPDSPPVPGAQRRLRYRPWRVESLAELETSLASWLARGSQWPLLLGAGIGDDPYLGIEGATCSEWLGLLDAAWRAGFRAFTVN